MMQNPPGTPADDRQIDQTPDLEDLLLAGIRSGKPEPLDPAEWASIRDEVAAKLADKTEQADSSGRG